MERERAQTLLSRQRLKSLQHFCRAFGFGQVKHKPDMPVDDLIGRFQHFALFSWEPGAHAGCPGWAQAEALGVMERSQANEKVVRGSNFPMQFGWNG